MARKEPGPADAELLTDPEGAAFLRIGTTHFLELQSRPGFPAPVWLSPRGKRHVRSELRAWALEQRKEPA